MDSDLLALAAARFDQLSDAERKLLQVASTGEEAPADLNAPENDPANAQSWGQDRAIRAALIQWLCFEPKAREQVHPFGIRAIGARIEGRLDLSFATISFPLRIKACWWPAGIVLQNTSLPDLSLTKCWVGPLSDDARGEASSLPVILARGVQIEESLFLDGRFHAEGCVSLDRAEVGGALNCDGGSFENANGVALRAEAARIRGAVSLRRNFKSKGQVLLSGAEIGGELICDGSFEDEGYALRAEAAKIGGDVYLGYRYDSHNFRSEGQVSLTSVEIGGSLICNGSFENASGVALRAEAAKIRGAVFLLKDFKGDVLLDGAEIGGALICDGGRFKNAKGMALSACGARIGGDVFLGNKNQCDGQVELDGAEIRGTLNCTGGVFENANGAALSAEGAKIGGDVFFGESRCTGEVLLTHAEIGGALNCDGSFENANRVALRAEAAKIRGAVFLHKNFKSEGEVLLGGAEIGGALICDGGRFKNAKGIALSAYGARIGGDVFLGNKNRCNGQVQLDGAEIRGTLNCDGGVFENAGGVALSAQGAKIAGDVYLGYKSQSKGEALGPAPIGFRSDGEVLLDRAEIVGALHCQGGVFKNANGTAFNGNYAKIGRDVILELAIEGKTLLEGASIAGDLTLSNTRIDEACPAPAIDAFLGLQRADIRGALDLLLMPKNVRTIVDLTDTSCTVFRKVASIPPEERKLKQWPMQLMQKLKQWLMQLMQKLQQKFGQKPKQELDHEFELYGFVYRRIEGQDRPELLEWLRKQSRRRYYRPQPYRQFANSLRAHGHDAEARACLISMDEDRRKFASLSWASRAWQWVLWITIRNGRQPLRALRFLLCLWIIGFLAFGWGYQKHVMEPSDRDAYDDLAHNKPLPGQYDPFCALVYAVDSILPIVSLGQRDRWHPRAPPITKLQTTASQAAAAQTTVAQTEEHSWLYGLVCEASFTGHWDPHGKWVKPSTLATLLAALRWAYVVLGWFFATMLAVGISGLVGRE